MMQSNTSFLDGLYARCSKRLTSQVSSHDLAFTLHFAFQSYCFTSLREMHHIHKHLETIKVRRVEGISERISGLFSSLEKGSQQNLCLRLYLNWTNANPKACHLFSKHHFTNDVCRTMFVLGCWAGRSLQIAGIPTSSFSQRLS